MGNGGRAEGPWGQTLWHQGMPGLLNRLAQAGRHLALTSGPALTPAGSCKAGAGAGAWAVVPDRWWGAGSTPGREEEGCLLVVGEDEPPQLMKGRCLLGGGPRAQALF